MWEQPAVQGKIAVTQTRSIMQGMRTTWVEEGVLFS
jgi:hypothetical protein